MRRAQQTNSNAHKFVLGQSRFAIDAIGNGNERFVRGGSGPKDEQKMDRRARDRRFIMNDNFSEENSEWKDDEKIDGGTKQASG